jgi:hypothetical protein
VKRQQIITALHDRLRLIRLGATFTIDGATYTCQSDVGARVFEWRTTDLQTGEIDMLCFWDPILDPDEDSASIGHLNHTLQVFIEYVAEKRRPEQARKVMADVRAAVGSDATFGGLADATSIGRLGNDLKAVLADRSLAGMLCVLEIRYSTPQWEM